MKIKVTAHSTRLCIMLFSITLLFAACAWVVVSAKAELTMQGPQQTAPAEKTVEQVQKNIKVLTGMPQSQLLPAMNFISASLGVWCTYCHVNKDDKWDFVSDEKPEKSSAREMIKMVQNINKTTFKGSPAVSCYTCHRGKTSPGAVLQLPLPDPTPAPSPGEAKPKEELPTVEQILARYQEALGGSAMIEKLKTRSMKGTWITPSGVSLGYEVYQSAPDRVYAVLNTPRQGVFERGFDGTTGWEKSGHGVRTIVEEELNNLLRYPHLFKDIKLSKEQFTRIAVGGKEKLGDRDVYVLRGVTPENKRERLYFDAQSGLLLRRVTSLPTMIGVVPEQIDFEDYRDVDGMKAPFTIRISSVDRFFSSTRKFTEVKLNVPVDETKFKKPAPQASPGP